MPLPATVPELARTGIPGGWSPAPARPTIASAVDAVLCRPDDQLDYARAKLAIDTIVDPSIDVDATLAELDTMAETALRLAGPSPDVAAKLAALRRLIYQSGPWNGWRPFEYDHADFKNIRLKLLSVYLATRRGNCVSMPLLFLILADRLGLDMAMAMAPNHIVLRGTDETGRAFNLEATSGANPARDAWYRQIMPMSDRAVESGLYLRRLSRREGVALIATTVIEHLNDARRYEEAIAVCEAILRHNPRCGLTLANLGNACFKILRAEFLDKYRSAFLIPLPLRGRYALLLQRNRAAFAAAEALGWEPNGLTRAT